MKPVIVAALLAATSLTHAGEMKTTTDNFTGKSTTAYVVTAKEIAAHGVFYQIGYVGSRLTLTLAPVNGVVHCRYNPVLLKDRNGTIHELRAAEFENRFCVVDITGELVAEQFSVRVPMFRQSPKDATIHTRGLDISQLTR